VVDLEQAESVRGAGRVLDLAVAGREDAGVRAPVDERVECLAVRADRRPSQDTVLAPAKAMSWTPSPWARTCSAISPSGVSGAVNTNRMSFWTIT
jgi:hypothetical protein